MHRAWFDWSSFIELVANCNAALSAVVDMHLKTKPPAMSLVYVIEDTCRQTLVHGADPDTAILTDHREVRSAYEWLVMASRDTHADRNAFFKALLCARSDSPEGVKAVLMRDFLVSTLIACKPLQSAHTHALVERQSQRIVPPQAIQDLDSFDVLEWPLSKCRYL